MRDKYGIQKKSTGGGKTKTAVLEEIKKDYGLTDQDARALQQKVSEVGNTVDNYSTQITSNFD